MKFHTLIELQIPCKIQNSLNVNIPFFLDKVGTGSGWERANELKIKIKIKNKKIKKENEREG